MWDGSIVFILIGSENSKVNIPVFKSNDLNLVKRGLVESLMNEVTQNPSKPISSL